MSYSDDLDWLARNANLRLAGNNTHIAKKSNGVDYSVLPSSGSGVTWFSVSDVQLRRAELQSKPSWHESGELPPVGVFVDVTGDVAYGEGEKGCEVIAHVEDCAVIRMSWGLGCFVGRSLSPHRTELDVLIEFIQNAPADSANLAAAILAAGFRREGDKNE